MEGEEERLVERRSSLSLSAPPIAESGPGLMVSATVGRVMTTLLDAKPKKLQNAISCLHSQPKIAPLGVSLEQSLCFLHKYIAETAEKAENLDQVLVPMIQHVLKMKGSKHGNQAMILLNWLFLDEILFQAIVRNFVGIIYRKDDRYVSLGWCILGRSLIEYDNAMNNLEINGIKEKCDVMLKIFWSCLNHLLSLICNGSNVQEGFELPTRLAVAAADFILSLSIGLIRTDLASTNINNKQKSTTFNAKNPSSAFLSFAISEREANTLKKESKLPSGWELKLLLWNNLDVLTCLVVRLTAWSRKSRSLHAKGLERVVKWLQGVRQQYGCFQNEADLERLKTGSLLLSSCWKHYGMLLHLEDQKFSQQYKELLDQYLSGIQFYADNQAEEPSMSKDSRTETINFFLNCLLLLLGRLDIQLFGNAITEFGSRVSQVLMSQLQCADENVIDGTISIFKAVIFGTNHILSETSLHDTRQMDAVLPLLLSFLDEQDAAAKAVVKLVAEYCSICSDSKCLQGVLKHIDSKNVAQRRNAVDIITDIIHMSSVSVSALSQAMRQDIADLLLKCLGDEDWIVQNQAANLIPKMDPSLVLPALVGLSNSTNERLQTSANSTLIALLIDHKQKPEILCMLLDCLSNLCQNPDLSGSPADSKEALDAGGLLKLLPEWAKNVEDWNVITGPLIDKMLAEPSNAVIVRFFSHVSEYLAEAAELIFHRLLLYARGQKEIDEHFSKERTYASNDSMNYEHRLFGHLCPLLVIKLLPLRVFDDLCSPFVYGEFSRTCDLHEDKDFTIDGTECIAALLMNRALRKSEFEDVQKLAAELCGRLHPKVLIPILSSQLECAANAKEMLNIKVCLFSFCTSLMVRGSQAYGHPDVFRMRKTIQRILHWPSVDRDETSKAQHGCIDCLALMLCSELQDPSSKLSRLGNTSTVGNGEQSGDAAHGGTVLAYVISQLTNDEKDVFLEYEGGDMMSKATSHLSFRLCMANVLISACQKISGTGKKPFVKKILPRVIHAVGVIVEPEIRAACIQVLFSVAYHLKSLILPYSPDLLSVTLKSLREGSEKEKMAGAKLLVSLMASEEEVVEIVSEGLLEARALLENLSLADPSSDVRQMCQQLLLCLISH